MEMWPELTCSILHSSCHIDSITPESSATAIRRPCLGHAPQGVLQDVFANLIRQAQFLVKYVNPQISPNSIMILPHSKTLRMFLAGKFNGGFSIATFD